MNQNWPTKRGFTLISAGRLATLSSSQWRSSDIKVQPRHGFTLIELLVVIAITGLLVSITIPSLISFNKRQQLKNAQGEVKSALRFTQNKALASEIDNLSCPVPPAQIGGAQRLRGWYAKFLAGTTTYNIAGRCALTWSLTGNPTSWIDFGTRVFQLPQNMTFSGVSPSPLYILFSPITGPVTFYDTLGKLDLANPLIISQISIPVKNLSGEQVSVFVTQTGEIK